MKKFLTISLFSFLLASGFAQDKEKKIELGPTPNNNLLKVLVIPKNLDTTTKDGKAFLDQWKKFKQSRSATYSHSTLRGKVYLLPGNNMPCLVPNTNELAPMPVITTVPPNNMPIVGRNLEKVIPKKD